jgi:hypothetical protein
VTFRAADRTKGCSETDSRELTAGRSVPASVSPDVGTAGYTDLEPRIRATLTGQKVSCGRFAGVWAPR